MTSFLPPLAAGAVSVKLCVPDAAARNEVLGLLGEGGVPGLTVHAGCVTHATHEAVVATGDSFGAAGVHLPCGTDVQDEVKAAIRREWLGELPVGAAVVIWLQGESPKRFIYAAAVRLEGDDNSVPHLGAYLAFRGALVAAQRAGIPLVSTPLLCSSADASAGAVHAVLHHMLRALYSLRVDQTLMQRPELRVEHRRLLLAQVGP